MQTSNKNLISETLERQMLSCISEYEYLSKTKPTITLIQLRIDARHVVLAAKTFLKSTTGINRTQYLLHLSRKSVVQSFLLAVRMFR